MKLPSLASTTQRPTRESVERVHQVAHERIRRVESMEGIEGDRQRSLRQELDEIEPAAMATFEGQAEILREALDKSRSKKPILLTRSQPKDASR